MVRSSELTARRPSGCRRAPRRLCSAHAPNSTVSLAARARVLRRERGVPWFVAAHESQPTSRVLTRVTLDGLHTVLSIQGRQVLGAGAKCAWWWASALSSSSVSSCCTAACARAASSSAFLRARRSQPTSACRSFVLRAENAGCVAGWLFVAPSRRAVLGGIAQTPGACCYAPSRPSAALDRG